METLGMTSVLVSDLGLREGVLIDLVKRKQHSRLRYFAYEDGYKEDAWLALASRFGRRDDFEQFYSRLIDPAAKDEFLRVATFYLFFVKKGDWHVSVEHSNPVTDYITNSFKIVALFSLIESLSDKQYMDFYKWLRNETGKSDFPIADRTALASLDVKYKEEYGSIRRCKDFFENLPASSQKNLCGAIKIDGKPLSSVKKVAEFLYNARSEFVHNAEFVLEVGSGTNFSGNQSKVVQSDLSMEVLLESIEEGILAYFIHKKRADPSVRQ